MAFSQYLIFTNLKIIKFSFSKKATKIVKFLWPSQKSWTLLCQSIIFEHSLSQTQNTYWGFNCLNIKGRNCLVICDRGVMDASAFITRDQWMTILERINFEEDEIRDNRYNQGNLLRGINNKTVKRLGIEKRTVCSLLSNAPFFWGNAPDQLTIPLDKLHWLQSSYSHGQRSQRCWEILQVRHICNFDQI